MPDWNEVPYPPWFYNDFPPEEGGQLLVTTAHVGMTTRQRAETEEIQDEISNAVLDVLDRHRINWVEVETKCTGLSPSQ